jgi:hypothetical protein
MAGYIIYVGTARFWWSIVDSVAERQEQHVRALYGFLYEQEKKHRFHLYGFV